MKLHHHFDLDDRCPDCMVDQGERCHCRDAQLDRHGPSMVLVAVVVALFWVAVAVGVKLALKGGAA
jgi:hypothetical protein